MKIQSWQYFFLIHFLFTLLRKEMVHAECSLLPEVVELSELATNIKSHAKISIHAGDLYEKKTLDILDSYYLFDVEKTKDAEGNVTNTHGIARRFETDRSGNNADLHVIRKWIDFFDDKYHSETDFHHIIDSWPSEFKNEINLVSSNAQLLLVSATSHLSPEFRKILLSKLGYKDIESFNNGQIHFKIPNSDASYIQKGSLIIKTNEINASAANETAEYFLNKNFQAYQPKTKSWIIKNTKIDKSPIASRYERDVSNSQTSESLFYSAPKHDVYLYRSINEGKNHYCFGDIPKTPDSSKKTSFEGLTQFEKELSTDSRSKRFLPQFPNIKKNPLQVRINSGRLEFYADPNNKTSITTKTNVFTDKPNTVDIKAKTEPFDLPAEVKYSLSKNTIGTTNKFDILVDSRGKDKSNPSQEIYLVYQGEYFRFSNQSQEKVDSIINHIKAVVPVENLGNLTVFLDSGQQLFDETRKDSSLNESLGFGAGIDLTPFKKLFELNASFSYQKGLTNSISGVQSGANKLEPAGNVQINIPF